MMRPNVWKVLNEAVESGVQYGLIRRCCDKRSLLTLSDEHEDAAVEEISRAVIDSICEWFDFDQDREKESDDQP